MTTPLAVASDAQNALASPARRRWIRITLVGVAVIALAHVLDVAAWTLIRDPQIYEKDWGRMLRITGFLPTWLVVAAAFWFHDGAEGGWRSRAGVMSLAPTIGGILAEGLKLVFRRVRPEALSPHYVFRAYSDGPFSNRGMGMPSSHVFVAMAAATVLARLFPRTRWIWYALVLGCAYTRVASLAHYLSDTAVAAVGGWIVGDMMIGWMRNKKPLEALAPSGFDVHTAD